jgi:ActR/RegA family two-component response regulator
VSAYGRALIDLAASTRSDMIVLDIAMPGLNGMDACAQLRRKMPGVRLVFLTVNEDPDIAAEAIRLGASGYLLKSSASAELFTAIEQALAGKTYITPLVTLAFTPRQLARILWDIAYLCWANLFLGFLGGLLRQSIRCEDQTAQNLVTAHFPVCKQVL